MIKRVNKITALLVVATSVISTMPVIASEKNQIQRLDSSDGSITNAVAFKDGKYLYQGSKSDAQNGVYYNDGTKDTKLDSVNDLDEYTEYGDSSVIVTNGNDEEKINLVDGTVSNDGDRDDTLVAAKAKLKTALSKTNKYGSDTEIKSFTEVSNNKFGDDVWYAYTATGNPGKYDDIFEVTKNLASGLTFVDEDVKAGKIAGTVSITKAEAEADIDSYSVYYLDENDGKIGDAIGKVKKTESPLQVSIADTDIPSGATQLGVYSVNSKGESETATKTTIVDTGVAVKTYKSQVKIEITAFYANIVIAGKTFSPSWGNNLPDSLGQAVKNTKFDNYTVVSTVSEHAFKDGSVDNDNGKITITLGTDDEVSSLPTDFVTFDGNANSWAFNVKLISDYAVPDKLANGITFIDEDTATNKISGKVSITKASDESNIDSYKVYYLNISGGKVGDAIGTVNKGIDLLQVTIADTDIPVGATKLGVYSVNAHGESVNATKTMLTDTKNDPSLKANTSITVTIDSFWGNFTVAGHTFTLDYPAPTYVLSTTAADIVSQFNSASYVGYKLKSASINNSGKIVAVFTTTESLSAVPDGFDAGFADYTCASGTFRVDPILDTSIAADTTTTTGAAVSVNIDTRIDTSTDTSSEKVLYYGYADTKGNYIDCSKIANIDVFNGKSVVKIDNFNDKKDKNDVTVKLGLPTLNKTLGQDKDYIYNLISVPVIGYQPVNGAAKKVNASTTLFYVQKISKAKSTQDGGAYLPKDVDSYYLSSDCGWSGGDNWGYTSAYNMLNDDNDDDNRKIRIISGNVYVGHKLTNDKNELEVRYGKLKLKKAAKITAIDNDGKRGSVIQPIVFEDFANDTKIGKDSSDTDSGSWTIDNNGNAWSIYNGRIKKSGQGYEWEDMYRCGGMNRLSVYDDANLIAWEDDGDAYVTVKEGEIATNTIVKSGWQEAADGSWHLYDLTGKDSKGWVNYNGSCWYYFNDQGVMQTGWLQLEGKTYYLEATGVRAIGWNKVDGEWYYFDATGVKQVNTTIDGYELNSNGVRGK